MKKPPANALPHEQRCPACDGVFTIGSGGRQKKVQCPQCRAVVSVAAAPEVTTSPEDASSPLPEWAARCEQLQARIEVLEQQVEALLIAPRSHSSLIPEYHPPSHHRPVPGESRNGQVPANDDSGGPSRALTRTFPTPIPTLELLVPAGDEEARRFAEALRVIAAGVGWKVGGVTEDTAATRGRTGLTLAASSTLPLSRITSTLNALRAAGYVVGLQLDPARETADAVLIVASLAAGENTPAPSDPPAAEANG